MGAALVWLALACGWAVALPGALVAAAPSAAKKQDHRHHEHPCRLHPHTSTNSITTTHAHPNSMADDQAGCTVCQSGGSERQGPCPSGPTSVTLLWGLLIPCFIGVLPFMLSRVQLWQMFYLGAPAALMAAARVAMRLRQVK
jgi:hypothetical protein